MKFLVVALFLTAFALCNCQTPTRPSLSTFFEALLNVDVRVKATNETIRGGGHWAVDQPKGMGMENFLFHNRSSHHEIQDIYRLQRYDLGYSYSVDNATYCNQTKVSGSMPIEFAWVAQANYTGQRKYKDKTLDVWAFSAGYAKVEIAVDSKHVNIPVFYNRETPDFVWMHEFVVYAAAHPNPAVFKVPEVCNKTGLPRFFSDNEVECIQRSTIIDRAQSWINAHIPYNQAGTYMGYREDCSGFVSMAWQTAKPGYTTFNMHEIAKPIAKNQLQPGDILLCPSESVVIFGGWVDDSSYIALEQTPSGPQSMKTPYPYWYNTACFVPYRYNSAC